MKVIYIYKINKHFNLWRYAFIIGVYLVALFNTSRVSASGSTLRQAISRTGTPIAAVQSSPHTPTTNTMIAPMPQQGTSGGIFAQGLARQGGSSIPYAVPQGPAFYAQAQHSQQPSSTALTAQQYITLQSMLEISSDPDALGDPLTSQEQSRQHAIAAFARVLKLNPILIDRLVPNGVTPIAAIISAILAGIGQPIPNEAEMVQLVQAFIDAINPKSPTQQDHLLNTLRASIASNRSGAKEGTHAAPPQRPRFKQTTQHHASCAAPLPPTETAPRWFPKLVVFGNENKLHPYIAGTPVQPNSVILKTDITTQKSHLKLVMSTGLLMEATSSDIRREDCIGTWTMYVRGGHTIKVIKVIVSCDGKVLFVYPPNLSIVN